MSDKVNCNADQTFQADLRVPAMATGVLGPPGLGVVTGIKLRISASKFGPAIHADVNDLAASERSGKPGRFYCNIDQAVMRARVLPLGENTPFYAVWYKAGDFDMESFKYLVAPGTLHS